MFETNAAAQLVATGNEVGELLAGVDAFRHLNETASIKE